MENTCRISHDKTARALSACVNVNEKPFNGVVLSQYIQTSQNRFSFADGGDGNLFAHNFLASVDKNGENTFARKDNIGGIFVTRQA